VGNLLIQVFCGEGPAALSQYVTSIASNFPDAVCVGVTTDGEIGNGKVSTGHTVIACSLFSASTFIAGYSIEESSYENGVALANTLITSETKLLLLFSDGTSTNAEELLHGINDVNSDVMIAGGMAGDNGTFTQTYVSLGDKLIPRGVVGVSINSDVLEVRNHYSFNWQPVGKILEITHSIANRVYIIDDKPAVEVYAHYLGKDIGDELPKTGIEFPLILWQESMPIARAVIAKHPDGSLSFAGNVPIHSKVQFGFGNTASILDGSVSEVSHFEEFNAETFFVYSCMARRRFMPYQIEIENLVYEAMAPTAGFYTYGEFFHASKENRLLNETQTLIALSENNVSAVEKNSVMPLIEMNPIPKGMIKTFHALATLIQKTTDDFNEIINFFDEGQVMLIKWKNDGLNTIEYLSSSVHKMIGYDHDDLLHASPRYTDLIHKEDIKLYIQRLLEAMADNQIGYFNHQPYRLHTKHHGYLWIYETTRFIRDGDGSITHIIAQMTDMTEQKKAEELLHRHAMIFEHAKEGIIITDENGRIISVNPMFTLITGYSAQEALGHNPRFLSAKKHPPEFLKTMWEAIHSNQMWQGEIWNRRKNGTLYIERLSIIAITDEHMGTKHFVGMFSDITDEKRKEEQINYMAHYDTLTGLPNSVFFKDRVEQALIRSKRNNHKCAVMFIDLDSFKAINDSMGHTFGDAVLQETGSRLLSILRESDSISRQGGDEFLILLEELDHKNDVEKLARKILDTMQHPFIIHDHRLHIGCSIGVAMFPDDGDSYSTLLQHADTAMYEAKSEERGNIYFFNDALHKKVSRTHALNTSMKQGMTDGEFFLMYQPQIDLKQKKIVGAEALVRWNSSRFGMVSPDEFITIAEENGHIVELGKWITVKSLKTLKKCHHQGYDEFTMAINVSAVQFHQADFAEWLENTVIKMEIDPKRIELELTESILIKNTQHSLNTVSRLKQFGFRLAIDDFGTGYSSLSYLKHFPADKLKIDKSFVRDLMSDPSDALLVKAIISLGKNFGMKVLAEGVEDEHQLGLLESFECEAVQGYFYSKPLLIEDLRAMLDVGIIGEKGYKKYESI
jgi:diguanylate cyclase (GGDEF)-like protein/PAS domain S-box-containing protein